MKRTILRKESATQPAFKLLMIAALFAAVLIHGCSDQTSRITAGPLKYNQAAVNAIDRELASAGPDKQYISILRGLRWCAVFCDKDENFDFTFTNYLTMLDEMTIHQHYPAVTQIVHELILKEFERAIPRLPKLFASDAEGYEDFVSMLPIVYYHRAPLEPFQKFAKAHFAGIAVPDRLKEFREKAQALDYDRLTDLVVGAAFINMAYRCGAEKDFRLPPDHYDTIMKECAAIPFKRTYKDDAYHDQNYYATHVLLGLNHYGRRALTPSLCGDRIFFYLTGQYDRIRNKQGDFDLLCEYLYCFKQFAPAGVGFIGEGERYIMNQQRSDGSWGTDEDFKGDPYDRLHPTWTAITLLVQKSGI